MKKIILPSMPAKFKDATNQKSAEAIFASLERMANGAAAGLYEVVNVIISDAKRRVPVDTGDLKGSGFVTKPKISGMDISVIGGFGGAAENYATIVHEDLSAHHEVGEAKYQSKAIDKYAQKYNRMVANAIIKALERKGDVPLPPGSHPETPGGG